MSSPADSPDRAARQTRRRRLHRNELRLDLAIGFVILAALIALPMLSPGRYILGQTTLLFIWGGVVINWNLVFGVAGIYSLAQMAVFLVGGYTVGLLGFYWEISLWVSAWLGAILAGLVSVVIGAATLRLRGPYVMLLTLAIAVVIQKLIQSDVECFSTREISVIRYRVARVAWQDSATSDSGIGSATRMGRSAPIISASCSP